MSAFLRGLFYLAISLIGFNSAFAQHIVLEGNALSNRAYSDDEVPGDTLFVTDFTVTNAGTLQDFVTWSETSSNGLTADQVTFHAYVLRPTGSNYQVMTDSGPLIVADAGTNFFSAPPFALQAGDVIAHYGRGIPLTTGTGGPSTCYFDGSVLPMPSVGQVLELPGPDYPLYNDGGRNYAIAVNIGDRVVGENSVPLQALNIALSGGNVVVTWPSAITNVLEQSPDVPFGPVTTSIGFVSTNGTNILTIPSPVGNMFFRLSTQ